MLESALPNGDIISKQTEDPLCGPKKFGTGERMGTSARSRIVARFVRNECEIQKFLLLI